MNSSIPQPHRRAAVRAVLVSDAARRLGAEIIPDAELGKLTATVRLFTSIRDRCAYSHVRTAIDTRSAEIARHAGGCIVVTDAAGSGAESLARMTLVETYVHGAIA